METTYDPIVAGPEPLPFLQLRRLAAPRLGLALVLVSSRGELASFPGGSPVPAARFGNYRSAYYIDTAEHQLYLDAQLPSSDPGFVFQAHLTYRCQVADPADVARRQIRDIGGLVAPRLVATMRAASRRSDIAESSRAEEAIEEALHAMIADPAVEITGCGIELPVQADEAASSGRSFRDTHRETRLTGMKVGPMRELLAGGNPALLALHLANHPEDTGPVMEMIVAGDIAEAGNMLHAIGIMYGRGGSDDEPFETRDERKKLMDRFLDRALPAGTLYSSGMTADGEARSRGSRLRGSLAGPPADAERRAIGAAVVGESEGLPPGAPGAKRDDRGSHGRRSDGDTLRPSRIVPPRPGRRDPDRDDEA
jgi:hypothetical protein